MCNRIVCVPAQSLLPFGRFNLTSYGSLIGVDWFGDGSLSAFPGVDFEDFVSPLPVNRGPTGLIFDLDGNGVEDCLQTVNGVILQRFGFFAGCYVVRDPSQGAAVFRDGLLAGAENAFGGDGTSGGRDRQSITPDDERMSLNLNTRYDFTPSTRLFFESKLSRSRTTDDGSEAVNGFFDSHILRWDSPFIPQNLRAPIETFVNNNTSGDFDVKEVFFEVSLPLLNNRPGVEDLTLDAAYRYSDYSTLGSTDSWNLRLTYAPIQDIRFRSTLSQTVRAPNINELFSPLQPATARPLDPCDVGNINNGTPNRPINCAADGLPANFTDPLTARFSGFVGGNPNLDVETADTFTAGVVLEPRFVPGLSITVDWYDIEIDDAISTIGVQQLVNACYDAATFPNQFCEQFARDRNPGSPTFLGFSSFVSSQLNFAKIVTQGVDYSVRYNFQLGDLASALDPYGSMTLGLTGNWVRKLERFEDPVDDSIINDLLSEGGQPKNAFGAFARWRWDRLVVNWRAQYWGKFLEFSPRIDNNSADNVENAWTGDMWRHDLSGSFMTNDQIRIIAGVNNVFDKQPVISARAYPVGIIGREHFLGLNARF
ncbi:MAG: TonB-dependent receptor [Wenzhouxiangella sp.]|nr:MAG: TonB-dependent receptor [Wenzhouxiangella sp.]